MYTVKDLFLMVFYFSCTHSLCVYCIFMSVAKQEQKQHLDECFFSNIVPSVHNGINRIKVQCP
jgi:hypothetical protein